jgi:hypothetical protein
MTNFKGSGLKFRQLKMNKQAITSRNFEAVSGANSRFARRFMPAVFWWLVDGPGNGPF